MKKFFKLITYLYVLGSACGLALTGAMILSVELSSLYFGFKKYGFNITDMSYLVFGLIPILLSLSLWIGSIPDEEISEKKEAQEPIETPAEEQNINPEIIEKPTPVEFVLNNTVLEGGEFN